MKTITYTTPNQYDVTLEHIRTKGRSFYRITYGAEIRETADYGIACEYLGQALMHATHCNGLGD